MFRPLVTPPISPATITATNDGLVIFEATCRIEDRRHAKAAWWTPEEEARDQRQRPGDEHERVASPKPRAHPVRPLTEQRVEHGVDGDARHESGADPDDGHAHHLVHEECKQAAGEPAASDVEPTP